MLRRFAGRALLAAKTSVKEPVKAKTAAKKKEKKAQIVIDRSKFHHNDWLGTTIFDLAKALPQPELPAWDERDTWLHKNGHGLKFYRPLWTRYPEPCYWTVAKIKMKKKPAVKHSRVWGFLTWRGRTEPLPRPIPGSHRKEWRILLEPGTQLGPSLDNCWTAPEITLDSEPKLSTQLPEDLPGVLPGTWPYPWGKQGTRNFPREPPSTERAKEIAQKRANAAKEDKSEHEDALLREAFVQQASIPDGEMPQALDYYYTEKGQQLEVDSEVAAGTKLFSPIGTQVALVQVDEDGARSIVAVDEQGKPVKAARASAAAASSASASSALPDEFDEDLLEDVDEDEDAAEDQDEDEDGLDDEDREWQLEDEENSSERGELDDRRGVYQKKRDRRAIDEDEDEDEDDERADVRLEKEANKEERARLMRRRLNRENGPRGGARFDEDGEEIDEDEDEEFDEDEEGEEAEEDAEAAEEETLVDEDLTVDAEAETADLEAEAGEGEVEGAAAEGEEAAPAAAAPGPKGAAGKKKQ